MKFKHIIFVLYALSTSAFCGTPIFSITQVIAPPTTIISGRVADAYYQVTNNTSITLENISVNDLPANVVQDPVGSGLSPQGLITCRATFDLAPNASCLLKLEVSGSVSSGPKVCQNGTDSNPAFCSTPALTADILNVTAVTETSTTPAISLTTPTLTPKTKSSRACFSPLCIVLETGELFSLVVTNDSSVTINNVQADFSGTALEGKVEVIDLNYTNACKNIEAGSSCTLYLVSYSQVKIAQTSFTVAGSNTKSVTASASVAYLAPNASFEGNEPGALMKDVLFKADMWADTPYIMAANYAFEGIQAVTNGEQYVKDAGGAWNTIYTANPAYGANTSATDSATISTAYGYTVYYEDAMPVCFSWPVKPSTVNPSSFKLTLNTGIDVYPDVASITPNHAYNERSCVVIFGPFGNRIPPGESGAVYPIKLTIVEGANGEKLTLVGKTGGTGEQVEESIVGQTFNCQHSYAPNAGPTLLAAKLTVMDKQGQCAPALFNSAPDNDGISLYDSDYAQFRLRLFTSGGFALGNFTPSVNRAPSLMPTDYNNLFQVKVVADGKTTWLYKDNTTYNIPGYGNITISGLASLASKGTPLNDAYLQDDDNQIDIVLYGDEAAMSKITAVIIPAGGTNPATGTEYMPVFNPGGPGNSPTPGVFYSQPGPSVTMPVTQALTDAKTVNLGTAADPCGTQLKGNRR